MPLTSPDIVAGKSALSARRFCVSKPMGFAASHQAWPPREYPTRRRARLDQLNTERRGVEWRHVTPPPGPSDPSRAHRARWHLRRRRHRARAPPQSGGIYANCASSRNRASTARCGPPAVQPSQNTSTSLRTSPPVSAPGQRSGRNSVAPSMQWTEPISMTSTNGDEKD